MKPRMKPILQQSLPHDPWGDPALARLPGVKPVAPGEWLWVDEAYGAQMAEKARLLAARREDVLALDPGAAPAARELLALVVEELSQKSGFRLAGAEMHCPDGRRVALDESSPLETLGRLVQEDFCILEKRGGEEHLLTGALLCFPASWTLREKFMRPLGAIHGPVKSYDAGIARRVQRMFDMIRPEMPLWRANALFYRDPALFQPRSEADPRPEEKGEAPWIRSERQTLLRLPGSGAIVFSIHTWIIACESLSQAQRASITRAGGRQE